MNNRHISFKVTDEKAKAEAIREAEMRGQTLHAAMRQIFEFGLVVYKEKVPVKFTPVGDGAELSVKK